jgi:metal-responsive CopG/Arc/MetJ family transcriptional regulator
MIYCHTTMPKAKVAITIEAKLLDRLDMLVREERFRNRSQAIETALEEKLERLDHIRLAEECGKLDRAEERALAEEGMSGELESWPEY